MIILPLPWWLLIKQKLKAPLCRRGRRSLNAFDKIETYVVHGKSRGSVGHPSWPIIFSSSTVQLWQMIGSNSHNQTQGSHCYENPTDLPTIVPFRDLSSYLAIRTCNTIYHGYNHASRMSSRQSVTEKNKKAAHRHVTSLNNMHFGKLVIKI